MTEQLFEVVQKGRIDQLESDMAQARAAIEQLFNLVAGLRELLSSQIEGLLEEGEQPDPLTAGYAAHRRRYLASVGRHREGGA